MHASSHILRRSFSLARFLLILCGGTAEGICEGKIGYEPIGKDGFGYDPIFMFGDKSFAELSAEEKDAVSHRGKALTELKAKLENYFKNN
mgnify:CR=1 FL=1